MPQETHALRRGDHLLLFVFCLLLFGYSMVGGRPLTMHEAVLPQSAREMLAAGEWIVPTSGGRPWLERPPLPQCVTAGTYAVLGGCDQEWVVRLPANLMGVAVVLIVAALTARWCGRSLGLLAGLILSTMFEFVSYAWLAEADIYLCLIVTGVIAVFARLEVGESTAVAAAADGFVGTRSWPVVVFFLLLGLTNLAKGFLFGTAMAVLPILGYLIWTAIDRRDWTPVRRYIWFWGWVLFAVISLAWPVAAYRRYPDVLELWAFDHVGRLNGSYSAISEPFWYYFAMLPGETAPWTLFSVAGLILVFRQLRRDPSNATRFLVCWALLPIVVFSVPSGKHHHYLVQCLAPWAIMSAQGLQWFWHQLLELHQRRSPWLAAASVLLLTVCAVASLVLWLLGAGSTAVIAVAIGLAGCACVLTWAVHRRSAAMALSCVLVGTVGVYLPLHSLVLPQTDQTVEDTAFLRQIPDHVERDVPLVANADLGSMDLFRNLFYLSPETSTVPDLDYLDDPRFAVTEVLVLTRARDRPTLEPFGQVALVLQSARSRRETGPQDRMSLFQLRYDPGLVRRDHAWSVSPMQAMGRD